MRDGTIRFQSPLRELLELELYEVPAGMPLAQVGDICLSWTRDGRQWLLVPPSSAASRFLQIQAGCVRDRSANPLVAAYHGTAHICDICVH
jgi:hypothetical protein